MKLPFDKVWWIEPGKIIGGRYPGTNRPEESRQMLETLVAAGVRVFVNLQEPGEVDRARQTFPEYEAGIKAIAMEHALEVQCLRFPIKDVNIPSEAVMGQILKVLQDAVAKGKLAYVNCRGGHGRTGTVAGCWMVENGLTGYFALRAPYWRKVGEFSYL